MGINTSAFRQDSERATLRGSSTRSGSTRGHSSEGEQSALNRSIRVRAPVPPPVFPASIASVGLGDRRALVRVQPSCPVLCPCRMDRPLNPTKRFAGSRPAMGSLGVAQPGQSAGLGSRRPSVRVRPPRPRGLGQQPSRLLRREEDASASLASPTISPRSSNGRAAVLHAADRGSSPSVPVIRPTR
jgi:hypothetical protein